MSRATLLRFLGISLCGAAVGCKSDAQLPEYPLDGITVFVGFDEPICGGTFDWIETRLRWLEGETGLAVADPPIQYYWLREDVHEYCSFGACGITLGDRMYSPLELFTHELVHGHLAQLGVPRPWLAEGMATMLEDSRWSVPDPPVTPSSMLEKSKPQDLSYDAAASFVRYLRDRFGMPALLELYAALDRVDAQETPDVFLAVLGEDWNAVEDAYLATFTPIAVGSINCDFPELVPEADTWTLEVAAPCEDATTIGPFLGWVNTDTPHSERYVTLEIAEAGTYRVTMSSSAGTSVELIACDEPTGSYSSYETRLDEVIELTPGRKRLMIATDIADAAVGKVVLRRAPPSTPVTSGPQPGLRRHGATPGLARGRIRADSGRGPV